MDVERNTIEMTEYLVLPGCDDMNRGDQALIWETVRLARDAGFEGQYYMMASEEHSRQSIQKGIGHFKHILPHPSSHFINTDNMKYTVALKIRWGCAAVIDMIRTMPLLSPVVRKMLVPFCSKETKESLRHFSNAKASFVKGGGFLHADGGVEESYKIFYFLYHINLALSYKQDVYIMPNSFGPFKAPFVKQMIRKTLSRCKLVTTREGISNEALRAECGIEAMNMPDLAFYLKANRYAEIKAGLKEKGIPIGLQKCVAITVRPYRFPGESEPDFLYQKYIGAVAVFTQWLSNNGYFPVFVEHVSDFLSHEDDMTAIKAVTKILTKETHYGVFSNSHYNCEEMKAVYSCFDFTVGTRFHSVIFSLSENVPSIAITYGGNKGQGIMKDLGLQQYAIDMKNVDGDTLVSCFKALAGNEELIKKELLEAHKLLDNKRTILIQNISSSE